MSTEEDAWQIALAYLQRWQIEQVWRVDKSEFGFESVRIRAWEDRLKLLSMAMLAHAFLLHLLDAGPLRELVRQWLLQHGCPQASWHGRLTFLPTPNGVLYLNHNIIIQVVVIVQAKKQQGMFCC